MQATFDDLNPATRGRWAYPDTGCWERERNVQEFLAMLPVYRQHGLLAVTVNCQGGSPEGYSREQSWEDDHFEFDRPSNNFVAALSRHASWGYFDPGAGAGGVGARGDYANGYQLVPVNWQIKYRAEAAVL